MLGPRTVVHDAPVPVNVSDAVAPGTLLTTWLPPPAPEAETRLQVPALGFGLRRRTPASLIASTTTRVPIADELLDPSAVIVIVWDPGPRCPNTSASPPGPEARGGVGRGRQRDRGAVRIHGLARGPT